MYWENFSDCWHCGCDTEVVTKNPCFAGMGVGDIRECLNCGLMSTYPVPRDSVMGEFYGAGHDNDRTPQMRKVMERRYMKRAEDIWNYPTPFRFETQRIREVWLLYLETGNTSDLFIPIRHICSYNKAEFRMMRLRRG